MSIRVLRRRPDANLLPDRTPALIARDERLYSVRVENVLRPRQLGMSEEEPELLHDQLLAALQGDSVIATIAAAFLAGRSTTGDETDDAETAASLQTLIATTDPARLLDLAHGYVEALMSSALLGDVDPARQRLRELVTVPDNDSIAGYLAAAYLAQFGDPDGYPILHSDLHERSDAHARVMAVRNLLSFVAHDGRQVGKLTIDVRAEYLDRLKDRDADVARAVPSLMVEAGLAGLESDLRAATKRPFKKDVREAAQEALDALARS